MPRKLLCTVELFHSYTARTRRDSLIDQHLGYQAFGGMFRHRRDRHIKNSLSDLDKIGMSGSTITNFINLRISRERCCATQGSESELPSEKGGYWGSHDTLNWWTLSTKQRGFRYLYLRGRTERWKLRSDQDQIIWGLFCTIASSLC